MRQLILFSFGLLIFTSCEVRSYEENALPEYDGDLIWTRLTKKAYWENRWDHAAVVFDNRMWVVGGYNPGKFSGDSYLEDVWSSNDGVEWTLATDNAPFLGRRGHQLVTFDDGSGESMYLIGGFSADEESGKRQYNNDVWKSDDGINWTEVLSNDSTDVNDSLRWPARSNHKCVTAKHNDTNFIYLIGGHAQLTDRNAAYASKYYNDIWRSADGINWHRVFATDFGIRSEFAAVVDDDQTIYIQGGTHGAVFETNDNASHPIPDWQNLWQSNDGKTWTSSSMTDVVSDGHLFRSDHQMIWFEDRIWTLPGKTTSNDHYTFTSAGHFQIWTYAPTDDTWVLDSEGAPIDARHGYEALVFNNQIFVLGGFTNKNGQNNDVWSANL